VSAYTVMNSLCVSLRNIHSKDYELRELQRPHWSPSAHHHDGMMNESKF
jgi:hypothetical protein